MAPEEKQQMESLCKQIQVEKDPKKFGELIQQLNELLERKEYSLSSGKRPFATQSQDATMR